MARLSIAMTSGKCYFKIHRGYLVASLSGDQSGKKQRISLHDNSWPDPTFEFTVVDTDARLKFEVEKKPFRGHNTVRGELDVPVNDLIAIGCAGDREFKVRRYKKEKIVAAFKISCKYFPAAPEPEEETVTASQAAPHQQTGNATPPRRSFVKTVGKKVGKKVGEMVGEAGIALGMGAFSSLALDDDEEDA